MAANTFDHQQLPTPQQWLRKHDFGSGNYETLSVFYVLERVFEGVPRPRILRCAIFGTWAPQQEFSAPDAETGQMLLDAHFCKLFPEHQCSKGCTGWSKPGGDDTPSGGEPVGHTVR